MLERHLDGLQLQPEALADLRNSFSSALLQLNDALAVLGRSGYLPSPWLGDETSAEVAAHYERRAMNDPDSSYQALLAYRDELTRVHDALQRMEDAYRRGEVDASEHWEPRA